MVTKADFNNIDSRLKNITVQEVVTIDNPSELPPTLDAIVAFGII